MRLWGANLRFAHPIGPRIGGKGHGEGRVHAAFYEWFGHFRPPGIREARVFTARRGSRVPKVQCFRVPPKPANSKSTCFCLLLGPPVLRMPCFLGPFRLPQCPNSRDMAPGPRDMVPGSSGGDFEPAAGRTGGQGPRRFKFQTGALCSDSRSEVRGGSAPRGGTYRFTVVHIPGGKFHGDSVTERRRRCAAMGQLALDLRD